MHSIQILHTSPPNDAISFDQAKELNHPIQPLRIYVGYVGDPTVRMEILQFAKSAAVPITLYTGMVTSECDAPCGCSGYDDVCEYHRYRQYDVAECFCSEDMDTVCTYHFHLHHFTFKTPTLRESRENREEQFS